MWPVLGLGPAAGGWGCRALVQAAGGLWGAHRPHPGARGGRPCPPGGFRFVVFGEHCHCSKISFLTQDEPNREADRRLGGPWPTPTPKPSGFPSRWSEETKVAAPCSFGPLSPDENNPGPSQVRSIPSREALDPTAPVAKTLPASAFPSPRKHGGEPQRRRKGTGTSESGSADGPELYASPPSRLPT